uniref:centrosomal protein of 44 kDa isoform X2 n=1 Tax=Solea senegalensis TaxID=28829 RepID=UPI001CD8DA46|nr:centrosomal protein of 44 kDa isoform X2 [Solea senegalensis]
MLSTGDVHGCLRKLESLLRTIKFPGHVDYDSLSKGDPSAFLPIVSFTLTSLSPPLTEHLIAAGFELTGKTDLRFTDTLYKVLRDIFQYKPILTKQQFLQFGFSQRKISVTCDVINLVMQKHNRLKKVPGKPFVVKHKESCATFATDSCHTLTSPSLSDDVPSPPSPENGASSKSSEWRDEQLSEVKERLSAVEAQLEDLQSGPDRLRVLEKRLQDLEEQRWRNTDEDEGGGDIVTVSRQSWENLTSRVLLLETKLELSSTRVNAAPSCSSCSLCGCGAVSSSPQPSAVPQNQEPDSPHSSPSDDLRERLESITNMLKSTSSLLKNTESSSSSFLQMNDE